MLSTPRFTSVFCFVFALLVASRAAAAPQYFDGLEHTLSSIDWHIVVKDSPDGIPTTLTVADPADVATINVRESSIGIIAGGEVSFLDLWDDSVGRMTGGEVSHIEGFGSSELEFTGGVASHIRMAGESRTTFRGGSAVFFTLYEESSAKILGGSMDFASAVGTVGDYMIPAGPNGSLLTIAGGEVGVARASAGGIVEILGGRVQGVNPFGLGTTIVRGGVIDHFTLNPETETNIYGSNLALTLDSFIHSVPQYTLTGLLEDGTEINARVSLPTGAELNLITVPDGTAIPEPSALASLGIGVAATIAGVNLRVRRGPVR